MLWDDQNNQAGRVGYKLTDDTKTRYFKKSGNVLN
jgi:ribosomal protein L24